MSKFWLVMIPAVLAVAIAILSVQNATLVSLRLFGLQSVALPFGIWIGLGLAAGMIGTAALLTLMPSR